MTEIPFCKFAQLVGLAVHHKCAEGSVCCALSGIKEHIG